MIVDKSGKPIGDQPPGPLPPGVQALIETRLNSAVDDLREHNRGDLRALSRPWKITAFVSAGLFLLSVAWNIFSWIWGWDQAKKFLKAEVDERMTQPEIQRAAKEATRGIMTNFVADSPSAPR